MWPFTKPDSPWSVQPGLEVCHHIGACTAGRGGPQPVLHRMCQGLKILPHTSQMFPKKLPCLYKVLSHISQLILKTFVFISRTSSSWIVVLESSEANRSIHFTSLASKVRTSIFLLFFKEWKEARVANVFGTNCLRKELLKTRYTRTEHVALLLPSFYLVAPVCLTLDSLVKGWLTENFCLLLRGWVKAR